MMAKKKDSKQSLEDMERKELGELKKIEEEMHYGTKELITGILIGVILGFIIAAVFM